MTQIAWHANAISDFEKVCDFYMHLGRRIALEFIREIELAVENIDLRVSLDSGVPKRKRLNIKRFPYFLGYYVTDSNRVWILTVSHQRREDQSSWKDLAHGLD